MKIPRLNSSEKSYRFCTVLKYSAFLMLIATPCIWPALAKDNEAKPTLWNNALIGQDKESGVWPVLWPNAPEWVKRTELDVQYNTHNGTQYNATTTQPLWKTKDKKGIFFAQGSYEH